MLPESLQNATQAIQNQPEAFLDACRQHLWLSLCALLLAATIALPLGVLAAEKPRLCSGVTGLFNGLRVIPSLAVLSLMIPLVGTGFAPSLLALTLLAIPPILIHTANGLAQVSPEIREAAVGMGMGRAAVLHQVSLPLAWPAILAGFRLAAVEVLAGATLAALIGGGGLGVYIVNGLGMYDMGLLLVGAVPIVLLVLLTEGGFVLLERLSRAKLHQEGAHAC